MTNLTAPVKAINLVQLQGQFNFLIVQLQLTKETCLNNVLKHFLAETGGFGKKIFFVAFISLF